MTLRAKKKTKAPADDTTVAMPSKQVEKEIEEPEEQSQSDENDSSDESGEEDDNNEGIPLSDLESVEGEGDVDIVPYQKLYKDNHAALTQALSTFALPLSTLPFHIHQSITSFEDAKIDINDDLSRELAFYKQALAAAEEGRKRLLAEGIPFSRPSDYFAEMVKDDEHMGKACSFRCTVDDRFETR